MKIGLPRFSVKTLLLIVLIASIIIGRQTILRKRHYRAIENLQRRGALLWDDWQSAIGTAGFYNCNLHGENFGGNDIRLLQDLYNLEGLSVRGCSLLPLDLRELAQLPKLQYLTIDIDCISDEHVYELEDLKHLKALHLSRYGASNAAIDRLRESLPNCEISIY